MEVVAGSSFLNSAVVVGSSFLDSDVVCGFCSRRSAVVVGSFSCSLGSVGVVVSTVVVGSFSCSLGSVVVVVSSVDSVVIESENRIVKSLLLCLTYIIFYLKLFKLI